MSRVVVLATLVLASACASGNAGDPHDTGFGGEASDPDAASFDVDSGAPDAGDALDAGDTADSGEPADAGEGVDAGPIEPAPLWDTTLIEDATTAGCTYTSQRTRLKDGVSLTVWNAEFVSYESIDGTLRPIRIKAFVAKPANATGRLPGVIQAHGLGGHAEETHATGLAAKLKTVVLAYTGPGGGDAADNTSEGRASGYDEGRRMFDTIPDPRGSWFWGHAMAAMRGVTCLANRDDVDASRLGMTGYSGGAVATLLASAADRRLIAGVPLSGTHAWSEAVKSPDAWQHELLSKAGYDTTDPHWTTLQEKLIDPAASAAHIGARVLMVNGSTDEFFPLTAHVATFDAIPGTTKRTSIAANFDHGCYGLTGVESASTIEARAELRASGGQVAWFAHAFGTDARFATIPFQPTATMSPFGSVQAVVATVDESINALGVDDVRLWWSSDGLVWGDLEMSRQGANTWGVLAGIPANVPYFVDVTYATSGVFPDRFSLSTRPFHPDGFVPRIRGIDSCQ